MSDIIPPSGLVLHLDANEPLFILFNFIWINQVDVTNTSLFEFVNTYKAAR